MQVYLENTTEFRYLTDQDLTELRASGLSDSQIQATGHFSIEDANKPYQLCSIRHRGLTERYRDWDEQQRQDGDDPPKYLTAKGEGNRNNTQLIFQHLLNQQSRTHQSTGELPSSACTAGFAGFGALAPQLNKEVR